MRTYLLSAAAVLALCTGALAETFQYPADAPVFSVTYPDSWSAEEYDSGVQGFPAEGGSALYVELASSTDNQANIDASIKFLGDNGVTLTEGTLTEAETEINGMPASGINIDGTDQNGPVQIGMYFIGVSEEQIIMVINWASKNEDGSIDETLRSDIVSTIDSIKPAAQ